MEKRTTKILLSSTMVLTTAAVATPTESIAKADQRPNLLVILLDDVCYDMFGCYGNTDTKTPNIDRLANNGVYFNTAWSSALSGPARAQIMTGKYATSTGAYSNGFFIPDRKNKKSRLFDNHASFSNELHKSGYTTAVAGKWHVGSAQDQHDPILGFDEYCMWVGVNDLPHYGIDEAWSGGFEDKEGTRSARYWNPCVVQNGELLPTTKYDFGPDIYCKFICDFMAKSAKGDAPFLAYYPMVAPHGPYVEMPTATKAGSNFASGRAGAFEDMISYIDILVGRMVSQLEESGVMDNTVVIFTADNGTAVTAKSRGVERGCHVPFIVSGKGIKARGATSEICDTSDIFPTLLDLAGVEIPACDGVSLKPFVTGATDQHKDLIHSCIGATQLLRTREYMMEVISPVLGLPEGRFYYCGDNVAGNNYQRAEGKKEHEETFNYFMEILKKRYIGLKADDPCFSEKIGERFLKEYLKGGQRHIENHKDYVKYDESVVRIKQ